MQGMCTTYSETQRDCPIFYTYDLTSRAISLRRGDNVSGYHCSRLRQLCKNWRKSVLLLDLRQSHRHHRFLWSSAPQWRLRPPNIIYCKMILRSIWSRCWSAWPVNWLGTHISWLPFMWEREYGYRNTIGCIIRLACPAPVQSAVLPPALVRSAAVYSGAEVCCADAEQVWT